MSWDEYSNYLQVAAVISGLLAFVIVAATAWVTIQANAEKDAKARRQEEEIARLNRETEIAKAERSEADRRIADAEAIAAQATRETAVLNVEAERARVALAEANEQIEIAKSNAARAREGIAIAESVSAEAKAEVGRLQKEISSAELKRIAAEIELERLKERVAWRSVQSDQREKFLATVRKSPKGTVTVWAPDGDPEAILFANDLIELLRESGWEVIANSRLTAGSTPVGISFKLPRLGRFGPADNLYHAAQLIRAIEEIGFEVAIEEDTSLPPDGVVVTIGHKPRPSK